MILINLFLIIISVFCFLKLITRIWRRTCNSHLKETKMIIDQIIKNQNEIKEVDKEIFSYNNTRRN